jgi:hypothetical protein
MSNVIQLFILTYHNSLTNPLEKLGEFNLCVEELKFSFEQHVHHPTHSSGHILDLIFTRMSSSFIDNVTVISGISDHNAIVFTLCSHSAWSSQADNSESITFRSYKHIDLPQFLNDLTHSFGFLQHQLTLNCSSFVSLYDMMMRNLVDHHAPIKSKSSHRKMSLPWFNGMLRSQRSSVRRAERMWRITGLQIHRHILCLSRMNITWILIRLVQIICARNWIIFKQILNNSGQF